jgi:hypothetical protein
MAILGIRKLCSNEEEFNNRILSLTTLIDVINTEELKKSVNKTTDGSINILKAFLEDRLPNYDKSIIANLRNIKTLRSKKFPIHSDDPKFIEALRYFDFNFPPDWGDLWEVVLKKYLECLEKIKRTFES